MDIEQFNNIKNYCNSFNTPVALFDGELVCIYCNKEGFLSKGERLAPHFLAKSEDSNSKCRKVRVIVDGVTYCARISEFGGEYYIGEFLDLQEIISLAEFSNTNDFLFMNVHTLSSGVSELWKSFLSLANFTRDKGDFETVDKLLDLEKTMNSISSGIYNISEYFDIAFGDENIEVVEVYRLLKSMIERCNTVLKKCDRAIYFVSEIEDYYICSNKQHVIVAMINALQNALLYSPVDSIPVVVLSTVFEDNKNYVVIRIVNDSIFFVDEKKGERIDKNFPYQHVGMGIPIIQKFAEKCGGLFKIDEHNGKVAVEVKIPQYIKAHEEILQLESPGYAYYKTDTPDFIDIMMNKIVNFFGKQKVSP